MEDKNDIIDKYKERLRWYTYVASYPEYNEQEVNYIIDYLKKNDSENEVIIEQSGIILTPTSQRNVLFAINKKKKIPVFKVVSSVVLAASLVFALLPVRDTIAGLKIGNFTFLHKDRYSASIIMPQSDIIQNYSSYDQLPEDINNYIWKLDEEFIDYKLDCITIRNANLICQRYKKGENYIELNYEDIITHDFTKILEYKNIIIELTEIDEINYAEFEISGNKYSIALSDFSIIEEICYKFIDYLL